MGLVRHRPAYEKGTAMRRDERGMVTAELAVACLVLSGLLALLVGLFGVVVVQLRCIDAASEIARQAARGDSAAVERISARVPPGAAVSTTRTPSGMVHVVVTAPVRVVPGLPLTAEVSGQAATHLEPGVR